MLLPGEVVTVAGLAIVLLGCIAILIFPSQMAHWGNNNWWARLITSRRSASRQRKIPIVVMRAMGAVGLFIALTTVVTVATSR